MPAGKDIEAWKALPEGHKTVQLDKKISIAVTVGTVLIAGMFDLAIALSFSTFPAILAVSAAIFTVVFIINAITWSAWGYSRIKRLR